MQKIESREDKEINGVQVRDEVLRTKICKEFQNKVSVKDKGFFEGSCYMRSHV